MPKTSTERVRAFRERQSAGAGKAFKQVPKSSAQRAKLYSDKMPKTSTERVRAFRERQSAVKALKQAPKNSAQHAKLCREKMPKTSTERVRAFRERQSAGKALKQAPKSSAQHAKLYKEIPKTSTECVRAFRERQITGQALKKQAPKSAAQHAKLYRERQKLLRNATAILVPLSIPEISTINILQSTTELLTSNAASTSSMDHSDNTNQPYSNFRKNPTTPKGSNKIFFDNPFGFICGICGRLWLTNDLKKISVTHQQLLPKDMVIYMKYNIMGSMSEICLKRGCIPNKWHLSQPNRRKRTCNNIERLYVLKNQRFMAIKKCPDESEESNRQSLVLEDTSKASSVITKYEDIDVDEHDILGNPRIKSIFPDLSIIKKEIESSFAEVSDIN